MYPAVLVFASSTQMSRSTTETSLRHRQASMCNSGDDEDNNDDDDDDNNDDDDEVEDVDHDDDNVNDDNLRRIFLWAVLHAHAGCPVCARERKGGMNVLCTMYIGVKRFC